VHQGDRSHEEKGRILLITSVFPRWAGDSIPAFVLHFAQRLKRIGWDVDVLAPHAPEAATSEWLDGVRVDRFRYLWPASQETVCYGEGPRVKLRSNRTELAKLPALLAAEWLAAARRAHRGYDLVSSHWILPQGLIAGLLPGGVPNVVTVHGGDVFGLRGRPLTAAKRFALRRAAAVTCNSSVTERAVHEIAPNARTTRIPMGVDPSDTPDPEHVAALRGRYRAGDGPLLAFVGRVADEKGITDFVVAVARLAQRLPDVRALIVGDGPDRAAAEQLALDLGIADHTYFVGWVEPARVPSYLAAADVFVAPSRRGADGWIEGQGLSIIEAMMAGVPVVATACGGIVETIDDGDTGLLVPERAPELIAAAVDRLVEDDLLRTSIVEKAQRSARDRFSSNATTHAFDELFRDVIARRPSSRSRVSAARRA